MIKDFITNLKLKAQKEKENRADIKIRNKKYRYIYTLRVISMLVIFLLALVAIGTALFVYREITNTIGQVQSIALYQSELRIELINFNGLDKIEKKWNEKYNVEDMEIVRNPFVQIIPEAPAEEKSEENSP